MGKNEEILKRIKSGDTEFKYIPEEIGEILSCDIDKTKTKIDINSTGYKKIKPWFNIAKWATIMMGMLWVILYEFKEEVHIVFLILTITAAFLYIYFYIKCPKIETKEGLFIGKEGLASFSFDKEHKNIINKKVILYKDADLIYGKKTEREKEDFTRESEENNYFKPEHITYYLFALYGKEDNQQRKVLSCVFKNEIPKKINGLEWKPLFNRWVEKRFNQMKEALDKGEAIGFNLYGEDGYYNDYIIFKGDEISIDGIVYNMQMIDSIYIEDENLIVRLNTKNVFGGELREENWQNNKLRIPLHGVANRKLFLKLLYIWRYKATHPGIGDFKLEENKDDYPEISKFSDYWKAPKTLHNIGRPYQPAWKASSQPVRSGL